MAKASNPSGTQTTTPDRQAAATPDDPQANANDPGGAHSKGYSAETDPEPAVREDGPVPLVPDSEVHAHAEKPDQSEAVKPAGPRDYTPNDRMMGADR